MKCELIGGTRYRPVCAPEVAARLKTPADLANVPVIRDTTTMLSWDAWLEAAGVPGLETSGPTSTIPRSPSTPRSPAAAYCWRSTKCRPTL